ncbi:MAG: MFS transporter [Clostridiaceae bacterium]|jgi:Na+/melibiose symporter-like transporter|nr:MFS transporter [Clostridiaceae bacterium]
MNKLLGGITAVIKDVKTHWKEPAEGNSLGYKEIAMHAVGGNGVNLLNGMFMNYAATTVNCLLTASVYGILPMDIWLIGVIVAIVGLIRMPLAGLIIDNTNTRWGKFKPLILVFAIPTALLLVAMAYIPALYMGQDLYTQRFIAIAVISGLLAFTQPMMSAVLGGLSQVMTMNTKERGKFYAINNVTQNLFTSLMQIILPPIAVLVAGTMGMSSVKVYQITFPFLGAIGLVAALASVFGTKERMLVDNKVKQRVKLSHGIKRCLKNKYFLILTSSGVLGSLRGVANIMTWVCLYQMEQPLGNNVLGIATLLCGLGYVPGMILAPLLANKFGKRKAALFVHALSLLTTLPMLIFLGQPFILLVFVFIQNINNGLFIVTMIMDADVLDYEQYKSGERLEGFFGNFRMTVIALFGIGTTLVTPFILQTYCGIDANTVGKDLENAYFVLTDTAVRNKVFLSLILIASASSFLGMIPFFFYDFTDKRHAEIIKELENRLLQATGADADMVPDGTLADTPNDTLDDGTEVDANHP